jgi:LacI family transcriptional regulator
MPTIRDVAKRAGVAPITVSRVINNADNVSDATRLRVEAAIDALGYVPNRLASSFRSNKTNTLGLILTDITNPFWTTVARGVEDAADEHGFNVILCNTDEAQREEGKYVRVLLQKQVDGFLLVPSSDSMDSIDLIQKQGTPLVIMDRRVSGEIDTVRCDSIGGAYALTHHLIDLGHRRIVALSGSMSVSTARDRVKGYEHALRDSGLEVDPSLIHYRAFTQEAGYAMTKEVLANNPPPTAIFAVNNFIAIGAYKALKDSGLHVPVDVSLVAFDDLPPALVMDPFLTVAAQPAYEMGRRATELLVERAVASESGDEPIPEAEEIVLPVKLVIRRSAGHPHTDKTITAG